MMMMKDEVKEEIAQMVMKDEVKEEIAQMMMKKDEVKEEIAQMMMKKDEVNDEIAHLIMMKKDKARPPHPAMARPPHPAMVPEIREALLEDKEKFLSTRAIEPYWFGKEAARQARLALIADEIGENAVREEILDSLVKLLTPWMLATNEDAFIYDDLWGGITSTAGLFGMFFMKDFGNGWFSDHHFQYGYFIYTAAVIGKYRPDFLQTHRDMISSIVRDYANPSSDDAWFPLSRHFSWYSYTPWTSGVPPSRHFWLLTTRVRRHSWASGVFELPGGKSQESVSEAINSYYAIRLLGISANDPQLRDWGTMLMACEMQAAQMYWQMPQDSNIYEPIFRQNKMLGQVAQTSAYYGTWFGSQVEYIHLVNVIPFTPVTELFISRAYVMEEYSLLQGALDRKDPPMVPIWRQYTSLMRAIVDPVAGLTELRAVDEDTGYDDGDSKTPRCTGLPRVSSTSRFEPSRFPACHLQHHNQPPAPRS
eukprot:g83429.t1